MSLRSKLTKSASALRHLAQRGGPTRLTPAELDAGGASALKGDADPGAAIASGAPELTVQTDADDKIAAALASLAADETGLTPEPPDCVSLVANAIILAVLEADPGLEALGQVRGAVVVLAAPVGWERPLAEAWCRRVLSDTKSRWLGPMCPVA